MKFEYWVKTSKITGFDALRIEYTKIKNYFLILTDSHTF
jgi:hypothetical protein